MARRQNRQQSLIQRTDANIGQQCFFAAVGQPGITVGGSA